LGTNHPHFLRHRDNAEYAHERADRDDDFETWLAATLVGKE